VRWNENEDDVNYMVRPANDESDTDEEEYTRIARIPTKSTRTRTITKDTTKQDSNISGNNAALTITPTLTGTSQLRTTTPTTNMGATSTDTLGELTSTIKSIETRMAQLEEKCKYSTQPPTPKPRYDTSRGRQAMPPMNNRRNTSQQQPSHPYQPNQTSASRGTNDYWANVCCYQCNQNGHLKRNCPNGPWVTGQVQVAVQPHYPPMPLHMNKVGASDPPRTGNNQNGETAESTSYPLNC
jgi:hypothetical protein